MIFLQDNRIAIAEGRCRVQEGDVAHLTLEAGKYDLATAFETIYFWQGLEHCFAEVAKLLKPDGRFMIVNESNGTDAAGLLFEKMIDGMKIYTVEEIEAALRAAKFSEIQINRHRRKPWIAVIATKRS